eukprot:RCo041405
MPVSGIMLQGTMTRVQEWLESKVCTAADPPAVRRQKVSLAFFLCGGLPWPLCAGLLAWWAQQFRLTASPLLSLGFHLWAALMMVAMAAVLFHSKSLEVPRAVSMAVTWLEIPISLLASGGFQYNSFVGAVAIFNSFLGLVLYEGFAVPVASVLLSCVTLVVLATVECMYGLPMPY